MLATTLMAVAGTFGIGMIIGIVVLMTAEEARGRQAWVSASAGGLR